MSDAVPSLPVPAPQRAPDSWVAREGTAAWLLVLACLMIGAGGVLLGLQVDANRDLVGTGWAALGIGALVALVATLMQAGRHGKLPREPLTALSAAMGLFGLASIVSGVLAPGGTWLFLEVLVLFWVLARRRSRSQPIGPQIRGGDLLLLGLMLMLRLWITYQGSRHEWALIEVELPILSWLRLPILDPIRTVSLGDFTPGELGFPATGLDFPLTLTVWATGFALCAAGLFLRHQAAREHENDRIHALVQTLPGPVAALVERLLPEDEWEELGLHGLPVRLLAKRIEALVVARTQRLRELEASWRATPVLEITNTGGFSGAILQAIEGYAPPERAPRRLHAREAAGARTPHPTDEETEPR